jgi:plasmid segregation protein ParM
MFFLLPLVGAAVGAVAGAVSMHAAGEGDRQKANYHREVANRLHDDYSKLQKKYDELEEEYKQKLKDIKTESHQEITMSRQRQAVSEEEKDLLRVALRLQQSLYDLMFDIDREPSAESLKAFAIAISSTNDVLFKLKEEIITVPEGYFDRNLKRVNDGKTMLNLEEARSNINYISILDRGKHQSPCSTSLTTSKNNYLIAPSRSRRSSDFMGWSD